MKIALIQQEASSDLEINRNKGVENVIKAAKEGAKIICFDELAFNPFYPQEKASPELLEFAETIPGQTTEIFTRLAKELDVVIVLNIFERDGDNTFDSSPVIDTDEIGRAHV